MAAFDTKDYGFVKTDNIFKGGAPAPTWDTKSDFGINYGGVPSYSWGSTGGMNTNLINSISYGNSGNSSSPDWLGKGMEALTKALTYKSRATSSPTSSSDRPQAANATVVGGGRGYTIFMPGPTQTTKQSATSGGGGIGSALGTIAGIGVSMIPGVGPAAAAAAPALGGQLGSLFG